MKTNSLSTLTLHTTAVAVGLLLASVAHAHHLPPGEWPPVPRTPVVYTPLEAVTADALMVWAQQAVPSLFPGPATTVTTPDFSYRYYNVPNVGENFIAVTKADSKVYVLGTATKNELKQFGVLNDFAPMVFPGRGVATTYPAGSLEARYFAEINDARIRGGFPAYKQDARLDQAASNHMKYFDNAFSYVQLLPFDLEYDGKHYKGAFEVPGWDAGKYGINDPANNLFAGHSETPGSPFFTGSTPRDRAQFVGYPAHDVSEGVTFGRNETVTAISGLVNTVFHRQDVLAIEFDDAGMNCAIKPSTDLRLAAKESHACIINPGTQSPLAKLPPNWVGFYPGNGQIDVPTMMDNETPNPAPEFSIIGAPVSIHIDIQDKGLGYLLDPKCPPTQNCPSIQQQAFHVTTFTVTDPDGAVVPGKVITNAVYGAIRKGNVFFAPKGALPKNTTYTVNFVGKETKFDGTLVRDIVRTWTFATGDKLISSSTTTGNTMARQSLMTPGRN